MPRYEIIETSNEIHVRYYSIDAVDETAAKELFYRGKATKEDEKIKDCLSVTVDVEEID